MKIDFTKRYFKIWFISIDTFPIKDFLVDILTPKYKFNMYSYLEWKERITRNLDTGGHFNESLKDFLEIGRYNNIYYTKDPQKLI